MHYFYAITFAQRGTLARYKMLLWLVTVALPMTLVLGNTTTSLSNTRAVRTTTSRVRSASTAMPVRAQIRLIAMQSIDKHRGIVEVWYNGEWGVVCDDYWDLSNARVACRQLGYADAISAQTNLVAMPERTDFLLDDVLCNGTEASIAQCDHAPWKQHDCAASELAGVTCLVKEASNFDRNACEASIQNFYCASTNLCVPKAERCNGTPYCQYGEDEAGCETSTTAPMTPVSREACLNQGKFYCKEAKSCIWIDWRCDGGRDCITNEDENNCTTENITRHTREVSPCGSTIIRSGHIQSPNYPKKYGNDIYCNWTLVPSPIYGTIVLKVYAFSTESRSDFVSIYNSSGLVERFSGIDIPSTISLDGSDFAVVEFTTDGGMSSSGFSISFSTKVSEDYLPHNICELRQNFYCTSSRRCIPMSDRCNGQYDCITSSEDEEGCSTTSVAVSTATNLLGACLDQGNFYCEYSGECIAMWHRCDGYSNCTYSEDEFQCDLVSSETKYSSYLCGGAFNGSGVLSSPNYPQAYPNNTFCSWKLLSNPPAYVLVISFQSFDTEAKNDIVRVYYDDYLIGTYSGSSLPPRMVLGSRGKITFVSRNNTSAKGFSFTFGSYEKSKAVTGERSQGKFIVLSGYIAALIFGVPRFVQQ